MLTIENLTVAYSKERNVIENLNWQLGEQKIHGLVGLNGAGKTTLLNSVFGLLHPKTGNITFHDQKINRKLIGYLETENYFYSNITGEEYLSLFTNKNFNLEQWNKLFELPLNTLIDNYSTGMKRKLALLGILKLDKQIVILDEPFNGLDLETCKILKLIILKLKERGKTVIVTSHILESLTGLCDEIHYFAGGKIKFTRSKENFSNIENEIFHDFAKDDLINELI